MDIISSGGNLPIQVPDSCYIYVRTRWDLVTFNLNLNDSSKFLLFHPLTDIVYIKSGKGFNLFNPYFWRHLSHWTQWASPLHVTKQLHCTVYNLELTLRQWSDLLTIFPTRWHLKVLNYVCFLTFTCEWYAQDSLKKYPDSYLSSWQHVTRPCGLKCLVILLSADCLLRLTFLLSFSPLELSSDFRLNLTSDGATLVSLSFLTFSGELSRSFGSSTINLGNRQLN